MRVLLLLLLLGIAGSVGSPLLDHLHLHQHKSSTTLLDMHHLSSFRYASPHRWNQLPSSFHLILFTLLLVHIRPKTKWAVLKYISPAKILNFYDICHMLNIVKSYKFLSTSDEWSKVKRSKAKVVKKVSGSYVCNVDTFTSF